MKKAIFALILAGAVLAGGCSTGVSAETGSNAPQSSVPMQAKESSEPVIVIGPQGEPIFSMEDPELVAEVNKRLAKEGFTEKWYEDSAGFEDTFFSYYISEADENFGLEMHIGYGGMDVVQLYALSDKAQDDMILETAAVIPVILDPALKEEDVVAVWNSLREKAEKPGASGYYSEDIGGQIALGYHKKNGKVNYIVSPQLAPEN